MQSHGKFFLLVDQQKVVDSIKSSNNKLFKKKLDIFDTMYYLNIISYGELQKSYKSQHLIVDTR